MGSIFDIKSVYMTPLIKWIIHHPNMMKSKIFLKAMQFFPEKISRAYDSKVNSSGIDYQITLSEGLGLIENRPQNILDICTGTGLAAFSAAKHFPDATITGVDQSAGMIEMASSKISQADALSIKFDIGNAIKLAYGNETYIKALLGKNKLDLFHLKSFGEGVVIIGQKK